MSVITIIKRSYVVVLTTASLLHVGCVTQNKNAGVNEYRGLEWGTPTLPVSIEKPLSKSLGVRGVSQLDEMVYITGTYSYLGISGLFAQDKGSVFTSLVLKKDVHDETWENAEVCLWEPYVEYVDDFGNLRTNNVEWIIELFALPEPVLIEALQNINDLSKEQTLRMGGICSYTNKSNDGRFENSSEEK